VNVGLYLAMHTLMIRSGHAVYKFVFIFSNFRYCFNWRFLSFGALMLFVGLPMIQYDIVMFARSNSG